MFHRQLTSIAALALLCGSALANSSANPTEGHDSSVSFSADRFSKFEKVLLEDQVEQEDATFEDVLAASLTPGDADRSAVTYVCPKGYGHCPQKKYRHKCCPLGGLCCNSGGCCKKGYYCVIFKRKHKKDIKGCCPNGKTCYL